MLDTIAHELTPDTTLGDIVDAAHDLGWAEGLGELCLADLALALFGEAPVEAPATPVVADASDDDDADDSDDEADDEHDEHDDDDADADADDDDADDDDDASDDDPEPAAPTGRKPSSLDRAVDRIEKTLAARRKVRAKKSASKAAARRPAPPKASKPAPAPTPTPARTRAAAKAAAKAAAQVTPIKVVKAVKAGRAAIEDEDEDEDDDTEAMSLDQAAKLLIPLVRKLREATMQDLEEQTKMGRRKLRFHIGQLVKHGRLRRHGMGRGTCYTVK